MKMEHTQRLLDALRPFMYITSWNYSEFSTYGTDAAAAVVVDALQNGADPNAWFDIGALDWDGLPVHLQKETVWPCLIAAVAMRTSKAAVALISAKADTCWEGLLHRAVLYGSPETIGALLASGIDAKACDVNGVHALAYLSDLRLIRSQGEYTDIVQAFQAFQCDLDAVGEYTRRFIAHRYVVLPDLVYRRYTALSRACENCNPFAASALLNAGADPELSGPLERTSPKLGCIVNNARAWFRSARCLWITACLQQGFADDVLSK